jgi:NAD-dependent deacetylase
MKCVFFTGAGMSKESGLMTFRGEDGMWDDIDPDAVASLKNWNSGRRSCCKELRQTILDFFNPIRRLILEKEPNEGHRIIADFEKEHEVAVVTQNGDDYHERAGSTSVIHLHGEALKNSATGHPYQSFDIDRNNPDIHIGDKAPDGSQVRPYVIFFGENLEESIWKRAVKAMADADICVIVGCSLVVFPAVDLLGKLRHDCKIIVINPEDTPIPDVCSSKDIQIIKAKATLGLAELYKQLCTNT